MMKRNIFSVLLPYLAVVKAGLKLLTSWFVFIGWSIVLGLVLLPYQVYRVFIPRRRGGHPISRLFIKAFEHKKAKRILGVSLSILALALGLMSQAVLAAQKQTVVEPTLMTSPQETVVTETTLDKPLEGVISQEFSAYHRAIDVLSPTGTPIKSVAEGVVKEARFSSWGWGNTVLIIHPNGLVSRYAHMQKIMVKTGEKINKNTEVGTVGMTGWTTGPHLHLEIYQNGRAIDPQAVLPEFNYLIAQVRYRR
jgi:murein DD-endopeptidase MepM/ murein hydrolase activator NlpD